MVMKVPSLPCFVMGILVLKNLTQVWIAATSENVARLNSNNSSLVTDILCGQIDAGDMAATWALLKQVVSASKPIPDGVRGRLGIRSGEGLGRTLLLPDTLRSSSSLRHAYGGDLST